MPKPKTKQLPLRSVKNWSHYVQKCVLRASQRRFDRRIAQEEGRRALKRTLNTKITREDGKRLRGIIRDAKRAGDKLRREKKLPRLELEMVIRTIVDTAFKNTGMESRLSAGEYSSAVRTARKFMRATMAMDAPQRDTCLDELERICGRRRAGRIVSELRNLRRVVGDWVAW